MLKSKLATAAAALALSFGAIGSVQAAVILAGDFKITINNYDKGTLYGATSTGVVCNTVGTCDTAAAPAAFGASSVDTSGIFSIASITQISSGAATYTLGQGGKYYTGVFGGLQDSFVESLCGSTGCDITTLSKDAGYWAIYENTADYDPTHGPSTLPGGTYAGITGGTMMVSGTFGAGVLAGSNATYLSSYKKNSISGTGSAFMDVTRDSGAWANMVDSNQQLDMNGNYHDLYMEVVYSPKPAGTANGWTVVSSGQITGNAVPEPGTMALAGLALLGAGLASRRRKS